MSSSLCKLFAKRYRATFGYNVFYGFILAAVAFGVVSILKRYSPYFSFVVAQFIYSEMAGVAYVYTASSLVMIILAMFFFPSLLCLDGISNNRWYLFSKLGISTNSIVVNRLLVGLGSSILSFVIGFVLIMALGSFTLFSFSLSSIGFVVKLVIIALAFIVDLLILPMAISTTINKKFAVSLSVLVIGLGLSFYIYKQGFFEAVSLEALSAGIDGVFSFGIPSLLLISVVIIAISLVWLFTNSAKRSQVYIEDELDEDMLSDLGIDSDVVVLEKGSHKYNVVISGPEIHGESPHSVAIPKLEAEDSYDDYDEDEEDEEAPRAKRRSQKSRKAQIEETDEDENEDENEDEEDDEDDEDEEVRGTKKRSLFGRRRSADDEDSEE